VAPKFDAMEKYAIEAVNKIPMPRKWKALLPATQRR
jgi:hypothetical protein